MKDLITNPYSFDAAYTVEKDSQGRATVKAKIMKVGKLKYQTADGKTFYGNITLPELEKAIPTASLKPVTIKHPPALVTPQDVTNYQEGVSADGYGIEDIEGEKWLTGPVVLQSDKAIKTAESGKLGVSAGYFRKAVPTGVEGEFNFTDIDINHIAIGCDNPRAEGAGLSLDEAEDDSARIYSFAVKQQPPKKQEVLMKEKLNAVNVGDLSMDEVEITYDEAGTGTDDAIKRLKDRESKLIGALRDSNTSLDEAVEAHKKETGDLSGANKGLTAKVEELEKKMESMVSLDDIESKVEELSAIQAVAKTHGLDVKVTSPFEGQKAIVEKVYPNQSFDDAEIPGAYKTIQSNPKDSAEMIKSKEALDKGIQTSMDDRKVGLGKIDVSELKRKIKTA